ncbi:MAG: DUF1016 domain-containing protein, partial [Pelodictyon phaeoclathratiforme]
MQQRASRSVDSSLVSRNWLFGLYIVEFERGGSDRAEYGTDLLKIIGSSVEAQGLFRTKPCVCYTSYI